MTESSLTRLNNVLAELLAEHGSESRLRRLRNYASALIEPVHEHVQQGLLTYEDAVRIMLAAAMFFGLAAAGPSGAQIRKRGMGKLAQEVFGGLTQDGPED
jgi:hypothetical protein